MNECLHGGGRKLVCLSGWKDFRESLALRDLARRETRPRDLGLVSQHSVRDLRIIYIEALLAQIEPAHELVELGDASNL